MYLANLFYKQSTFWSKVSSLLLCLVTLCACAGGDKRELVASLNEDSANQITLTLMNEGISDIVKEKVKDGSYTIFVNSNKVAAALSILNNAGLPPEKYTSFGDVFKKDSFISTPIEEHGRFIYALEQEIANMISQINGVTGVNVVVNVPQASDNLWQDNQPKSSASVLVNYQQGSRLDLYATRIKSLVCNAVPGLLPSNVEVVLIPQKLQ